MENLSMERKNRTIENFIKEDAEIGTERIRPLKNKDINVINDFLGKNMKEIASYPFIGEKTVAAITKALKKFDMVVDGNGEIVEAA